MYVSGFAFSTASAFSTMLPPKNLLSGDSASFRSPIFGEIPDSSNCSSILRKSIWPYQLVLCQNLKCLFPVICRNTSHPFSLQVGIEALMDSNIIITNQHHYAWIHHHTSSIRQNCFH